MHILKILADSLPFVYLPRTKPNVNFCDVSGVSARSIIFKLNTQDGVKVI